MTERQRYRSTVGRRRFLQGVGAAGIAGAAGCLGDDDGGAGGEDDETEQTVEVDDADTVVQLWSLLTGGDGVPFEALVEEFNETHDDIGVEVQRVPWDEYYDRVFTAMTAQEPPDVAFYHTAELPQYIDTLVPLDDHIDFSPYLDNIADSTEFDGTHYSAPMDSHPVATYYNKDLYAEAGYDEPPQNWDEFQEVNDELVDMGYTAYDTGDGAHLLRVWLPWVAGRGTDPLIVEDGEVIPNFNNEDGLAVTEAWQELTERDWADVETDPSWEDFNQGEHGALNEGTWAYSRYREGGGEELDYDWGIYNPGIGPGAEENLTLADSHSLGVPEDPDRSDDVQEAAIEFIRWFTQERDAEWSAESGHLPPTESALEGDYIREAPVWDRTLETFYEMAVNDQLMYMPPSDRTGQYQEALYQNINAVRTGSKEPQEALDDAEQRIENIWD